MCETVSVRVVVARRPAARISIGFIVPPETPPSPNQPECYEQGGSDWCYPATERSNLAGQAKGRPLMLSSPNAGAGGHVRPP